MRIEELDVVKLKDGRQATVLNVYDGGKAYLVEIADGQGRAIELPTVSREAIIEVTWRYDERSQE